MGLRRGVVRLLAILAVSAIGFVPGAPVSGQSSSDSSPIDTGLQMLQGLSSDQRDSIMNQLGGAGASGGTGGGSQSLGGRDRQNDQQQGDMDQDRAEQLKRLQEDLDLRSPYLKGDDWIIVAIDINPLPPLTQPTNQQLQQQQQQQQANGLSGLPASALSAVQASSPAAAALLGGAAAQSSNGVGPNPNANGNNANGGNGNGNANGSANPNMQQQVKPELTEDELKERDKLLDLIRSKNPYQLSHDGALFLPGFAPDTLGRAHRGLGSSAHSSGARRAGFLHPRDQAASQEAGNRGSKALWL